MVYANRYGIVGHSAAIDEVIHRLELDGYVRGAFTGATGTKKGKFAVANRGTIFLDEIGATSGALQTKLLRVLQEREIEPLGSERTEPVDIRVIAATNRDLRQLVDEGRSQDDLYYRLQVFPIAVPPLRQRAADIPLLTTHFVNNHGRRSGKNIEAIEDGRRSGSIIGPATSASSKIPWSVRSC